MTSGARCKLKTQGPCSKSRGKIAPLKILKYKGVSFIPRSLSWLVVVFFYLLFNVIRGIEKNRNFKLLACIFTVHLYIARP